MANTKAKEASKFFFLKAMNKFYFLVSLNNHVFFYLNLNEDKPCKRRNNTGRIKNKKGKIKRKKKEVS